MTKTLRIFFLCFLLSSCAYEPILSKKNYNFSFSKINSDGDIIINKILEEKLITETNNSSVKDFELYFFTKKEKELISSNKKGDPTIFKLNVNLNYKIKQNGKIILENELFKQTTYNNINDKFELLKKEGDILNNLSERLSDDILIATANLLK